MSDRIFRPFPIEAGLVWRANDSEITRWTMFIGAKLSQSLVEGDRRDKYMGWIDRLYQIIVGVPASQALVIPDARARMSGLREVSCSTIMQLIISIDERYIAFYLCNHDLGQFSRLCYLQTFHTILPPSRLHISTTLGPQLGHIHIPCATLPTIRDSSLRSSRYDYGVGIWDSPVIGLRDDTADGGGVRGEQIVGMGAWVSAGDFVSGCEGECLEGGEVDRR